MYNNRLLQKVAVVVALMAAAVTSGVAAASAPTGPERNVAFSPCLAILRQELGTVMPSGWSGYQESDCSSVGAQPAALTTLDNPSGQWIGPETVSAALGQQSDSFPTTGGSGDLGSRFYAGMGDLRHFEAQQSILDNPNGHWIGPETVSAALGQQSDSFPTTGGSGDLTSSAATWRDAGASAGGPGSPAVSTSSQMRYGPPGR